MKKKSYSWTTERARIDTAGRFVHARNEGFISAHVTSSVSSLGSLEGNKSAPSAYRSFGPVGKKKFAAKRRLHLLQPLLSSSFSLAGVESSLWVCNTTECIW